MPSSRRQISTTARPVAASSENAGSDGGGALDEEPDGLRAGYRGELGGVEGAVPIVGPEGRGQSQRGHSEDGFALDAERLAARGEHAQAGTAAEQAMGHLGGGPHEVLAVVEEQEQLLRAQVVDERVEGRLPGLRLDPQGPGDLGDDEPGVADGGELDEPGAVALEVIGRGLQREARLAGAADPDEGDQATGVEQARDLGELPLASHEGGDLERQVRGGPGCRAERRERPPQARRGELVDVLGPLEIAQAMLALVEQLDARGQLVGDQDGGGARGEHLAAVPDGEQAGDPVEGGPEEVAVARLGGPRVDRHAHAQRPAGRPGVALEGVLALEGGQRVPPRVGRRRPAARRPSSSRPSRRPARRPPGAARRAPRGRPPSPRGAPPRAACSPRCR